MSPKSRLTERSEMPCYLCASPAGRNDGDLKRPARPNAGRSDGVS